LQAVWTDHRTRDRFAVNLVVAAGVLVSATLVLVGGLHPGSIPRGVYYAAFYLSGCVTLLLLLPPRVEHPG